jgi:DNA-binding response OmpR family regulator
MDNHKVRVLIVDDEETVTSVVLSILSSKGHHCDVAADGERALELFALKEHDAVITDVVMPGMNGLALTRELVRLRNGIPIMVMTGYGETFAAEEAMAAGASEFIAKPFTLAEFDLRFQKMIRQAELLQGTRDRQNEIQRISASMISGIERDAYDNISRLQQEIKQLKSQLSAK